MNAVAPVFRKELSDGLRDRRSLMAALIFPITGPLLFAMLFTFLAKKHSTEKPLELPVEGAAHAPSLLRFLEREGVIVQDPPADPETAVREGDVDVVLRIPSDYAKDFRSGRPATVQLIIDDSRDAARSTIRRARRLLDRYAAVVGSLRLVARGVSPDVATAVSVEEIDLATPQKMAANLLSMVPYFAMLAAFMGGMNLAIDTTAGERERGSLEPLLINPVPRLAIVAGKWLVTALFNVAVALLTLIGFHMAIRRVPLDQLGVHVEFGWQTMLAILVVVAPLAFFASALLMTVATFARSYKEGQTYLSMLVFVPMLPALVLMFNPIKPRLWMMLIPTFGQNILVNKLMRGEGMSAVEYALASLTALALAAAILWLAARLYQRERIIFGR